MLPPLCSPLLFTFSHQFKENCPHSLELKLLEIIFSVLHASTTSLKENPYFLIGCKALEAVQGAAFADHDVDNLEGQHLGS